MLSTHSGFWPRESLSNVNHRSGLCVIFIVSHRFPEKLSLISYLIFLFLLSHVCACFESFERTSVVFLLCIFDDPNLPSGFNYTLALRFPFCSGFVKREPFSYLHLSFSPVGACNVMRPAVLSRRWLQLAYTACLVLPTRFCFRGHAIGSEPSCLRLRAFGLHGLGSIVQSWNVDSRNASALNM